MESEKASITDKLNKTVAMNPNDTFLIGLEDESLSRGTRIHQYADENTMTQRDSSTTLLTHQRSGDEETSCDVNRSDILMTPKRTDLANSPDLISSSSFPDSFQDPTGLAADVCTYESLWMDSMSAFPSLLTIEPLSVSNSCKEQLHEPTDTSILTSAFLVPPEMGSAENGCNLGTSFDFMGNAPTEPQNRIFSKTEQFLTPISIDFAAKQSAPNLQLNHVTGAADLCTSMTSSSPAVISSSTDFNHNDKLFKNDAVLQSLFGDSSADFGDVLTAPASLFTDPNTASLSDIFLSSAQQDDFLFQDRANQTLQQWCLPDATEETSQIVYGPETLKWIEAIYDESVSVDEFILQMSQMMCSHVSRFLNLFENSFIQWIHWMMTENSMRFRQYMMNNIKELLICHHDSDRHGILQTLLVKHFLDPANIPRRIQAFLYSAKILCNELDEISCGFCPREHLSHVTYYPFHLVQLVRASLTRELRKMWIDTSHTKPDGAHSLIELNSLASELWFLETGQGNVKEMGPFHISLVPVSDFLDDLNASPKHHFLIQPFLWPSVFSDTLPFSTMFLFQPSMASSTTFNCGPSSSTHSQAIIDEPFSADPLMMNDQDESFDEKKTSFVYRTQRGSASTKRRKRNTSSPLPISSREARYGSGSKNRVNNSRASPYGSNGGKSRTQDQVLSCLQGAYAQSDHHLTTYRDFEMMCARLINRCMVDFVSTAIKQCAKSDMNASISPDITEKSSSLLDSPKSNCSILSEPSPTSVKKAAWDFIEKRLTTRFTPDK